MWADIIEMKGGPWLYHDQAGVYGRSVRPLRLRYFPLIRPPFKDGDWSVVPPIASREFDVIGPDLGQSILVVGSTRLPSSIFPRVWCLPSKNPRFFYAWPRHYFKNWIILPGIHVLRVGTSVRSSGLYSMTFYDESRVFFCVWNGDASLASVQPGTMVLV